MGSGAACAHQNHQKPACRSGSPAPGPLQKGGGQPDRGKARQGMLSTHRSTQSSACGDNPRGRLPLGSRKVETNCQSAAQVMWSVMIWDLRPKRSSEPWVAGRKLKPGQRPAPMQCGGMLTCGWVLSLTIAPVGGGGREGRAAQQCTLLPGARTGKLPSHVARASAVIRRPHAF